MPDQPLVSVIVLNYNGRKFADMCFQSLRRTDYRPVEIIMVDNASNDGSPDYVARAFPEVRLIRSEHNLGYTGGNNLGMAAAAGRYLVLLNNDVEVDPGWLTPLVAEAEKDALVGALQPKLTSMINKGYFEYAGASGGFIDRLGYAFLRGRIFETMEKDDGQYDDVCDIFWASGAALFLRKSALDRVGLLDETFFMHYEEIDLCWRLNSAGYTIRVVPSARVLHHVAASLPTESFNKMYWNHRNSLITLIKNLPAGVFLRTLIARLILDGVAAVHAAGQFNFRRIFAVLKAHLWIHTHWVLLLKKRRQVKRQAAFDEWPSHVYPGSIVVDYFLKKKHRFSMLHF